MTIKIAHISDLHIGGEVKFNEMHIGSENAKPKQSFFSEFQEFVEKQKIEADYLFITGDITNKGNFHEYNRASEIVHKLASMLSVRDDNIMYVPGNHDKLWIQKEILDGASDKDRRAMQYTGLFNSDENNIFSKITKNKEYANDPYFFIKVTDDLIAVGCNSAVFDEPGDYPHNGRMSLKTIEELDIKLKNLANDKRAKLFLIHHHFIQFTTPFTEQYKDFSIMENGNELLKCLTRNGFDFALHGHHHYPQFQVHIDDFNSPLIIVCAGTLSALLPGTHSGCVENLFHLIEIDPAPVGAGFRFQGKFKSWSHRMNFGWEPSHERSGIEHLLKFGRLCRPEDLKNEIEPIIMGKIKTDKYVNVDVLLGNYESAEYITNNVMNKVITDIAEQNNLVVAGSVLHEK